MSGVAVDRNWAIEVNEMLKWFRSQKIIPRMPIDNRARPETITVYNESTETIPEYGCMRVTDATLDGERRIIHVTKPNSDGGPFLFNGPRAIPATGTRLGQAQVGPIVDVQYTGTAPNTGEKVGPGTDWLAQTSGQPVVIALGVLGNNIMRGIYVANEVLAYIPLRLSQTGGSAGGHGSECSYTYTVTHAITGESLGTAVDPTSSPHKHLRHGNVECDAATEGFGYIGSDGNLVIQFIHEPPQFTGC